MKFTIDLTLLKKALSFVASAAEKKPTIPILSSLLFSAKDGDLKLAGTDLDVTAAIEVIADVEIEGGACLPAQKIVKLLDTYKCGDVHFSLKDNGQVTIKAGNARPITLASSPLDSFPDVIKAEGKKAFTLRAETFAKLLQTGARFATMDQSRYALNCVMIRAKSGQLQAISTNGHAVALASLPLVVEFDEVMIPQVGLQPVYALCKQLPTADISVSQDENHIYFQIGESRVISRKSSGQYPNIDMVIPNSSQQLVTAKVAVTGLRVSIQRAILTMEGGPGNEFPVNLTVNAEGLGLRAQRADAGEADELVSAETTGEMVISFNSGYLLTAIADAHVLEMRFKDGVAPASILFQIGDISVHNILMPMRIK